MADKISRPARIRLPDFSGKMLTLPGGAASWRLIGEPKDNGDYLILGLGPKGEPPLDIPDNAQVYWLEAPAISEAIKAAAPPHWQQADIDEAIKLASACNVYFYMPGSQLAPDFWPGLLAEIELAASPSFATANNTRAWLPGNNTMLLHQELRQALHQCGFEHIYEASSTPTASVLREIFANGIPKIAISVNCRGLDAEGRIFSLCQALGIKIAIWFVDNCWNILSSIPLPWWKQACLFVTDKSFLDSLRAYGAENAHFLPLAGSPHMAEAKAVSCKKDKPLFVGRSAFPDKGKFFAGVHIEHEIWNKAVELLQNGQSPDFHWWGKECNKSLWPGKAGRIPALGADNCSALRRSLWLSAATAHGLRIVGDNGWRNLLPAAKIYPPVDYYGSLPRLYANAECCLNITSLLLPESLSQRHFDVWLAGGYLLSDPTRGLDIFDQGLVENMKLENPGQFGERLDWLKSNPARRQELIGAWRRLIISRHLYAHRIRKILEII